jgi:hypothetical protein
MATKAEQVLYHELAYYTLSHPDPAFIHQHAVDAFAAQTADEDTKAITLVFGLVGLYLYLEKGFTGRKVQEFHMLMAKDKQVWPEINLPPHRGMITAKVVLAAPEGTERDAMIRKWCESVWEAYTGSREIIMNLVAHYSKRRTDAFFSS